MSPSLTTLKPLTVWITTNWKILKKMLIPDHLTCFPRSLYADQEAIVRTGHGSTDWFKIGKGVRQGCVLSPCLFNLYAEYIVPFFSPKNVTENQNVNFLLKSTKWYIIYDIWYIKLIYQVRTFSFSIS